MRNYTSVITPVVGQGNYQLDAMGLGRSYDNIEHAET